MAQVLEVGLAVLIAGGILMAVAAGVCLAGVLWLRRAWRRRRLALALRFSGLATAAAVSGVQWLRTRQMPNYRWWVLHRARRDLLRATMGAQHAVKEAKAADVTLGDLEVLTRRLTQAAMDVDRSLRIAQQAEGEPVDELLEHSRRLATSGARIQRAAAESLAGLHRRTTDELTQHVLLEERAFLG
jgi:hypothetical protein